MKKLQIITIIVFLILYILNLPLTVLVSGENADILSEIIIDENANVIIQCLPDNGCESLIFQDGYNKFAIQFLKGIDNNLLSQSGYLINLIFFKKIKFLNLN